MLVVERVVHAPYPGQYVSYIRTNTNITQIQFVNMLNIV